MIGRVLFLIIGLKTDKDPVGCLKISNELGVCALGFAIFGVEIVEHWGSPKLYVKATAFFLKKVRKFVALTSKILVLLSTSG